MKKNWKKAAQEIRNRLFYKQYFQRAEYDAHLIENWDELSFEDVIKPSCEYVCEIKKIKYFNPEFRFKDLENLITYLENLQTLILNYDMEGIPNFNFIDADDQNGFIYQEQGVVPSLTTNYSLNQRSVDFPIENTKKK